MRFYELRFKLVSPAIITFKRTEKGFLSTLKYIPASMVRGALISSLYWEDSLNEERLKQEATEPQIIASPAYPYKDNEKAYPSHPFTYECKVPHGSSPEDKEIVNYMNEILPKLTTTMYAEYKTSCSKGHIAIAPLHPNPVIPLGIRLKKAGLSSYRSVSVGISKHKGSAERGMLFEYESISAGQEFWATLTAPEDLEIQEGLDFSLGRGISRGFGRAKLTMIREISLDESARLIGEAIENNTIILYSLSQMVSIRNGNYSAYPQIIDLQKVAKRAGINGGGKLIIDSAYGRTGILFAGWDMMKNQERPTFSSAGNSGSILTAKVEAGDNVSEAIAALGLLGTVEMTGGLPITGVNMLVPIRGHPMGGG